jgi:hypothetical protein
MNFEKLFALKPEFIAALNIFQFIIKIDLILRIKVGSYV